MLSLGSRLSVALAIALACGAGGCSSDDGDGEGTLGTVPGEAGDGDGDGLEGDGDGDGDAGDGDGDGDESPETGDGDGDGDGDTGDGDADGDSGDGDGDGPMPGECPDGSSIIVSTIFYTEAAAHPEGVSDACSWFSVNDGPGEWIVSYSMANNIHVRIEVPKSVAVGLHDVVDSAAAGVFTSITVNEYLTDAWLGIYGNPMGTVEILESTSSTIVGVLDVTVTKDGDHYIDAVIEFSATLP